jgi:hypothetical protein
MGSGCIDPHFLDLGTSWKLVVSFTLRPLYPRENSPLRIGWEVRWTPEPVWTTWRKENSWTYRNSNSEPSVVQPAASRYTVCAIPAAKQYVFMYNFFNTSNSCVTVGYNATHCNLPVSQNQLVDVANVRVVLAESQNSTGSRFIYGLRKTSFTSHRNLRTFDVRKMSAYGMWWYSAFPR